jgi:hypothetical protein
MAAGEPPSDGPAAAAAGADARLHPLMRKVARNLVPLVMSIIFISNIDRSK